MLPLDTVEGIWRIIISTFTYVQAPYSVHVDVSRGDAAMRDSARFHFGFTVPCVPHMSARGVIGAVADAAGDLGMFALDGGPGAGAWWMRLARADAPKVIARLPFVERPDHPAGMPIFVIAKPLADGGGARRGAGGGDARPMARRVSAGDRGARRRDHRQRRRRHGPVAAGRAAGHSGRRVGGGARWPRRAAPTCAARRSARTPRASTDRNCARAAARRSTRRRCPRSKPVRPQPRAEIMAIDAYVPGKSARRRARQGPQAVVERIAARPFAARDRGVSRQRRISWRSIPTARRGGCARRSPGATASTPSRSSAATVRTS